MDRNLRNAFLRNVHGVTQDAYRPGGRALYGPEPSGNYAEGPLPEYFAEGERDDFNSALFSGGLATAATGGALAAPGLAPWLMPLAGLSGNVALAELLDSRDKGRAADMWSNTGMPQRPSLDDGHLEDAMRRGALGPGTGTASPAIVRALMHGRRR